MNAQVIPGPQLAAPKAGGAAAAGDAGGPGAGRVATTQAASQHSDRATTMRTMGPPRLGAASRAIGGQPIARSRRADQRTANAWPTVNGPPACAANVHAPAAATTQATTPGAARAASADSAVAWITLPSPPTSRVTRSAPATASLPRAGAIVLGGGTNDLLEGTDVVLSYQALVDTPNEDIRTGMRLAPVWASAAELASSSVPVVPMVVYEGELPEGLEIVGRLPELLDNLAAQTEQEPQFPGEGEL